MEQEKAFESGGSGNELGADSDTPKPKDTEFGGAKVGDLVQWEIGGVLQMEKPMRVRLVQDGWIAVEGSETGIPMNEVIVQERASIAEAPRFKLPEERDDAPKAGTRKAIFPLDQGDVTLIFPDGLPQDALADLGEYLDIFLKKEGRKAGNKGKVENAGET